MPTPKRYNIKGLIITTSGGRDMAERIASNIASMSPYQHIKKCKQTKCNNTATIGDFCSDCFPL